jgi:hypothetical protein
MLTVFPRPTDPVLNINTIVLTFTRYSSLAPENNPSHQRTCLSFFHCLPVVFPPPSATPLTLFVAGTVAEMASKTKLAEEEENPFVPPPVDLDKIPLVDKDRLIADTVCSFDFSDLQSWLREVFLDQSDEVGLWESNLPLYMFPQVHHFPEFALKCRAHYLPEQKAIISSAGDVLFFITPEDIDQMMQITRPDSVIPFSLEVLTELYQKMTFPQRAQIFELFSPPSSPIPTTSPPYPSSTFSIKGNQIISAVCALLGYFSDQWVDEPILGFLSIFSNDEQPTTQFDYSTFLANNIHDQFMNFPTEGVFRYSSILAYMFLYFQAERFKFSMQKMDADGKPQPVTAWTSLLKRNSAEYNFAEFIDQFYHPVLGMLTGVPEPRVNDEVRRVLHLAENTKTGDWYLYQNHSEIRVYGCELAPFKLPKYMPVRIFALEYIRQIMNSDDIHFVSLKKKQQLRLKGQIGSFICNNRGAGDEADRLLREMKFTTSFPWHYDPHGIISEMRVKNKNAPYVHEPRPEIEKYANQTEWEPDTLEDVEPVVREEQQGPSTSALPATTPQVLKEKRPRQESPPLVTEVSMEEFQTHSKKPKITSTIGTTVEATTLTTTVTTTGDKQFTSSFGSSQHKEVTVKTRDSPLDTPPSKTGPQLGIFEKYDLIKKRNQSLTSSTYAQFQKQSSTAQHRLLSAFDTEKGKMHMAYLHALIPDPKVISDYRRTTFEFQAKDVHPADQMDMHKQTGEMISHTLARVATSAAKYRTALSNAQTQLKLEKMSSFAKDSKIKTLEELVLKIGYDPANVKAAEEMIKKKNADIAALRKQLKLPPTEDPQTKEIAEREGEKDEMLRLLMEQSAQLKEMEAEMEKLLQEKEQTKTGEGITLSAIPIAGLSATTVTAIPSATAEQGPEGTIDLAKSMERMNLQESEISRLKKELENLQELKTSFQTSLSREKQVNEQMRKELQQLQKQTLAGKTLAEVKELVWTDIAKSINEIWPMVQIMFEQNELLERSKQAVEKIRTELGDMPAQANDIIRFLNSKTREELEELKIEDRTETILEVKRVLTKRSLMLQLEEKIQVMDQGVQRFFLKIDTLQRKGLPGMKVINDKLMVLPDYKKKLIEVSKDCAKFAGIQSNITGRAFMEALHLDFEIQHEIKHIFVVKPTFAKYTDMDEVYRRLLKVTVPTHIRWEELCDLLD